MVAECLIPEEVALGLIGLSDTDEPLIFVVVNLRLAFV